MPAFGTILLDGFNYGIADVEVPTFGPTGEPTGETISCRELQIAASDGLLVSIRLQLHEWDEFARKISGSAVVVARQMPPLNGHL